MISTVLYITVELQLGQNRYTIHIQFGDHRIFQSKMSEVSKSHYLSLKSSLNIEISGYFFMTNFNFLIKEYSYQK